MFDDMLMYKKIDILICNVQKLDTQNNMKEGVELKYENILAFYFVGKHRCIFY